MTVLVTLWLVLATADLRAAAEDVFARARRLNPTLRDSTAAVTLELDATMGPLSDRRKLTGTYYYKREGRHKLELPDAPSYLQSHTHVFGFSLPRLERYSVRSLEETTLAGQSVWRLELQPLTPQGSIERLEMWIHRRQSTVLQYDTYYTNGQLKVTTDYALVQGQRVPASMLARFAFPNLGLRATVRATYGGYRFNQGLSDQLFNKP